MHAEIDRAAEMTSGVTTSAMGHRDPDRAETDDHFRTISRARVILRRVAKHLFIYCPQNVLGNFP
jgi:hypothetical protein